MNDIILYMLGTWSIFGTAVYIFMCGKVKLPFQKVILCLIGGPLVWVFLPIMALLDFVSVKVFEPVYYWLTKK